MEAQSGKAISEVGDWAQVGSMVRDGTAEGAFPVNTKFVEEWKNTTTGSAATYDDRFRVVDYGPVNVKGRGARDAMWLQQAYCMPMGLQFDNFEAFYAVPAGGLAAGVYNVTAGTNSGKLVAGTSYQFTLTKDLPEGGQLAFNGSGDYNVTAVNAYASKGAATAQESVSVTVGGTGGTNLGTLTTNTVDEGGCLNHISRVTWGSNRWATSALRQWLNSDKAAGSWWTPQTKWDRPPSYATNMAGYLAGLPKGFVENLAVVEVKTAKPYCDGGTANGTEADTTYDRVFLPSAEQLYWTCTSYGVPYGLEGRAWQYYKELHNSGTAAAVWSTLPEYIMTSLGAETTARYVFERSASRNTGYTVSLCSTSGTLSYASAVNGGFCAPACCIV